MKTTKIFKKLKSFLTKKVYLHLPDYHESPIPVRMWELIPIFIAIFGLLFFLIWFFNFKQN